MRTAEVTQANMTSFRAAKAKRIRYLMQSWAENSIQLGKELKAARQTFTEIGPHGEIIGWKKWLKEEVGISDSSSYELIQTAEKFGHLNAHDVKVSFKVLKFLARSTTPDEAIKEIFKRSKQGERIGSEKAKKIAARHRPPPKEANRIARDTGKPTLASDGYLYLGGGEKEVKESAERRTVVYAVRRAIETLAAIEVTPTQFLDMALPHQLWTKKEEGQISEAAGWLNALKAAWSIRK